MNHVAIEGAASKISDAEIGDIILPGQYFAGIGATGLSSEQRLVLAVLIDAVHILQGWQRIGSARKRRAFAEAAQWVTMPRSADPFSFDNICDALNINAECLRERLSDLALGHANAAKLKGIRLCLKESGRTEHMTPSRDRRRGRAHLALVPG